MITEIWFTILALMLVLGIALEIIGFFSFNDDIFFIGIGILIIVLVSSFGASFFV